MDGLGGDAGTFAYNRPMKVLQSTTFEPYIPKKLGKALKAYKPKKGVTLDDVFDEVYAIMREFEAQRGKARGSYSFAVVYYEDLNKFLSLIQEKYPNAKQLCIGVLKANDYLDKQTDEHSTEFDSLTKH